MLQNSPARNLLLRTIGFQIVALATWWLVLYQPSLMLLRVAVEVPFTFLLSQQSHPPLQLDTNGIWNFSVPMNTVVNDPKDGSSPRPVGSIDFAAPPENVAPFTTGWFVYLGLALSLPFTKAHPRRTLIGFAIQTAINALALFVYVEVNALGILASLHATPDPFYEWLLKYAYHIDYLVIPYAGPFLLLLLTHPDWWAQLTAQSSEAPSKGRGPAISARTAGR